VTTRTLTSVGIDVGTTTTRMVVSRLRVHAPHRTGGAPRLVPDVARTVHAGAVHLTPLLGPDRIDLDALRALVTEEYAAAGIDPDEVDSGAVVVTGETALRRDADEVARTLSLGSGRFVVAVAGPRLEARIAGQGSGAAARSGERYGPVVNLDVGGGSTNRAAFRAGRVEATSAILVGGRAIELDPATGRITALGPHVAPLLAAAELDLDVGSAPSLDDLRRLTTLQARLVADELLGVEHPLLDELALTPLGPAADPDAEVLVSGGVGDCLRDRAAGGRDPRPVASVAEAARYGDLGPLLAEALATEPRLAARGLAPAPHAGGATVAGAATRTVTLSGTTIWVDDRHLPLRDLVVVRPVLDHLDGPAAGADAVAAAVAEPLRRAGPDHGVPALALDLPARLGFDALQAVAAGTVAAAREVLDGRLGDAPLVVVCPEDLGRALGQAIHTRDPELGLVVVDRVALDDGDLIDLGRRDGPRGAVPVSVKTLVFTRDGDRADADRARDRDGDRSDPDHEEVPRGAHDQAVR
jgi:ethanolamine utilization protein EutA